MFGHGYFGSAYFGGVYFGPADGDFVPPPRSLVVAAIILGPLLEGEADIMPAISGEVEAGPLVSGSIRINRVPQ